MFRQVNSKLVFSVILQSVLVLSFLTACQKDDKNNIRAARPKAGAGKTADKNKPAENATADSQANAENKLIESSLGFEKIDDLKNEKIKNAAASVVVIETGSGDTAKVFTGFISHDGQQVITTLSNLVDYLKEEMKSSSDEKIKEHLDTGNLKIKLAISDMTGKVLITQADEVKTVSLSKEQKEYLQSLAKSESAVLADQNNVVRLALDKKIGSALKLVEPKESEKVFVVGYSEKTTDRAALKAKDADGESIVVSSGVLIDLQVALKSFKDKISEEELVIAKTSMLATNSDSTTSMIGSPILNEQGEVVGLLMSSSDDLKTKKSFGLSAGTF